MKAKLASCPTIAIRADGSRSVGMGHVMRTLSIAEALRVAGAHVLYVCADKQPKEIIESRGFEVLVRIPLISWASFKGSPLYCAI